MDSLVVSRCHYILTFVFLLALVSFKSVFSLKSSVAKIEILKINKRSAEFGLDYDYDVSVTAFDTNHRLKLRSADSILSPNFKYHEIYINEVGQTVFDDLTPNQRTLRAIEKDLYVDVEKNAAVRLREINGNYELNGFINGARIRREDDTHFADTSDDPKNDNRTDYVDLHRPISQARSLLSNKVTKAEPEIAIVLDYENSKLHNFNQNAIMEYLTVLFNAINIRFALNKDPKVTFQIVGVHILKSKSAEPFIEQSKNAENKYSFGKIVKLYGKWVKEHMEILPKHDIAPLIVGVPSDSSMAGLAPINGACWFDAEGGTYSAAITVSEDIGGYFQGSHTLVHELAHSLGAPHDGDGDAHDCKWSDGYLMSYEGWGGINKFHMSPCTQREMKAFLASSGGSCCLMKHSRTKWKTSSVQVNDKFTMKHICEKAMDNPKATVLFELNADVSCQNIRCKVILPNAISTLSTNHPAGNNSPCGLSGKCENGYCVGQKKSAMLTLDQICQMSLDNPQAKAGFEDPNVQCSELLLCIIPTRSYNHFYNEMRIIITPPEGTSCGDGGKCEAKKCVGGKPLTMEKVCPLLTGRPSATPVDADAHDLCSTLKCKFDLGGEIFAVASLDGNTPNGIKCGTKGGVCKDGKCSNG